MELVSDAAGNFEPVDNSAGHADVTALRGPASRKKAEKPEIDTGGAERQFRQEAERAGLVFKHGLKADGDFHRCQTEGDRGSETAGAYILHLDGDIPAGGFQNWRDGKGWITWKADIGRELTDAETAKLKERAERDRRKREEETARRQKEVAKATRELLKTATPAPDDHPYLVKKGVRACGLRVHDGALLMPLQGESEAVHSYQLIRPDGTKRFPFGGRKKGLFYVIGGIDPAGENLIGEGFATMADVHGATGRPCVVALDAGNLLAVAEALRKQYPKAAFTICADDDAWTDSNPGKTKASEAAKTIGAKLAEPKFSKPRENKWSDFNDLARVEGLEAVRRCIEAAKEIGAETSGQLPKLREAGPYVARNNGLFWIKYREDGNEEVRLTNFCAWIIGERIEDDGVERRSLLEIEAEIHRRTERFTIPANSFSNMGWALENIGSEAVVEPGVGSRDRARAAIQYLSGRIPRHHSYAHSGWRKLDGHGWAYLHAGGAVGASGAIPGVDVAMPDALANYCLNAPNSAEELAEAVRASLNLINVAADRITATLLGSVYRAAIGNVDYSLHFTGFTGSGKSELAALGQQHFGAEMHAKRLPGSWSSTANSLEGMAFTTKDSVFTIDDYVPQGSAQDKARLNQTADRVMRGVGNSSGRGRCGPDGKPRPAKPPRALVISTGEETPGGQSLRARMFVIEVAKGAIGKGSLSGLTDHQAAAASGKYAMAMAGFIQWLANGFEEKRREFDAEAKKRRNFLVATAARGRTADIEAQIATAWRYLIRFAVEVGAISQDEAQAYLSRADAALAAVASEQGEIQSSTDPIERFTALLSAVISSGRAHIAGTDGGIPASPMSMGWRKVGVDWQPQGRLIGWEDGTGGLYLEPTASFAAVQEIGSTAGDAVAVGGTTLWKRMHDRKMLKSVGEEGGKTRLTVKKTVAGGRPRVVHVNNLLSISEIGGASGAIGAAHENRIAEQGLRVELAAKKSGADEIQKWGSGADTHEAANGAASGENEVPHELPHKKWGTGEQWGADVAYQIIENKGENQGAPQLPRLPHVSAHTPKAKVNGHAAYSVEF